MDNLLIKPNITNIHKADKFIKLLDKTNSKFLNINNTKILSKVAKDIKTITPPVIRYFDSPGQINTYYWEGEYDLTAIFKLLKHESYFARAVDKKLSLATKSGFAIKSDNDTITSYFNKRFLMMQLQTDRTLSDIIRRLLFYLFTCRNAFLIKVRDSNFEYASSYYVDGNEMKPVVGYFTAHPTTMKPKFTYKKESGIWKAVMKSWIQTNKKGIIKEFLLEDVIHFTINKEDGMVFATPDIIPVIDDIRTFRKIEEDVQLLIYRDLFPIIHYQVENPEIIDHATGTTELDLARKDMQRLIQDGGIATDKRHNISFVGNENKSLDVSNYLSHFQQRVFTGLGVSASDMSIVGQAGIGDKENASKSLIDSVKCIQQEFSEQFKNEVLLELALQSPFEDILEDENMPNLCFEEIDIEWKIRGENHEADLFAKGTKTIHEVRNSRGDKNLSDEDLMYTHQALFGNQPPHKTMIDTKYGDEFAKLQNKIDPPTQSNKNSSSSKNSTKTKKSSANNDPIKASKTNSNIVKNKFYDSLNDSIKAQDLKDKFINTIKKLEDTNKINKVNITFVTKIIYDNIKSNIMTALDSGANEASKDLNILCDNIKIEHNIFDKLDKLRDDIANKVYNDLTYINKAGNRIAITNNTETIRARNYAYVMTALNNNIDEFIIYSDSNNISDESFELLGKELKINKENILDLIPPYHPNSKLKVKIKEKSLNEEE